MVSFTSLHREWDNIFVYADALSWIQKRLKNLKILLMSFQYRSSDCGKTFSSLLMCFHVFYSCDKTFSELLSQNTLRWITIWLPLKWQNFFFWTLMSDYPQIENHSAVTHVTRFSKLLCYWCDNFFPNSHVKIYSSEKPFGCFSCD